MIEQHKVGEAELGHESIFIEEVASDEAHDL